MRTDESIPVELRLERQEKIIQALIRRADRQNDIGPSAFRAFQSSIELQEQVEAQTRDLERAETELQSVRYERERTRRSLVEALSSMADGFALFQDGHLHVTNDFLLNLLPETLREASLGIGIDEFFEQIASSQMITSSDHNLRDVGKQLAQKNEQHHLTVVIELRADRWYHLNAQHTSQDNLVLLVTEITELVRRNRFEKETLIDLQKDYLQAVFQHMSSGVCTVTAVGRIMMLNLRFQELLGVPASELKPGMDVSELIVTLHRRGLIELADRRRFRAWRSELQFRGFLNRRIRHGSDKVLDIHVNRLPDGGYVIELKDVTLEVRDTETLEARVHERTAELTRANLKLSAEYAEKAKVEEQLRIEKERAEAAISSKTRFLAAASHDLLQPINAAQLLISTLQESTIGTQFHDLVNRLEGSFSSAEQLLRSLLDISRLESAEQDEVTIDNVSLGSILDGLHGDQALVAEKKNVRLDVVPCKTFVRSDPVYLLRSIQNLLVNAIQYTEPGGRVLVGCRRRGNKVAVEVWDTGIGIALGDQKRIFEEFARAEGVPLGTGMGLGLSVVERACRLLGHELSVRSMPGVGSVFSIEMAIGTPKTKPEEPPGFLHQQEAQSLNYIVLVIENDADVLYGTTLWLEQAGADVLAARSIAEAVTFVEDMGMPPDIILADYQLDDGETGVEGISRIREMTGSHVPAIIITANRSEGLREAAILNDVSVMTKPVKLSRLRRLISWNARRGFDSMATETKVGTDTAWK